VSGLRRYTLGALALAEPAAGRAPAPPGMAHLDYPDADVLMWAQTVVERRWRVKACAKEPWTAEYVAALGPDDLLFNVGACVGSYALIAASRGARVVAVEASPVNAARLAQNVAANGYGDLVTVVLAVCGPSEQAMGVGLGSGFAGAADVEIGGHGITLPGVTLDGLADVHGRPTALLIDVDGGELDVLRGGAEVLADLGSVLLEVSRDPRISDGCMALLRAAGLPSIEQWSKRNGQTIEGVYYSQHRRAA
jgi:FkbM family methyltransferase